MGRSNKKPLVTPFNFKPAQGRHNEGKWVLVDRRGGILTLPMTEAEANEAHRLLLRGYNAALDDDAEDARAAQKAHARADDLPEPVGRAPEGGPDSDFGA